jgi:hypothetical protein
MKPLPPIEATEEGLLIRDCSIRGTLVLKALGVGRYEIDFRNAVLLPLPVEARLPPTRMRPAQGKSVLTAQPKRLPAC